MKSFRYIVTTILLVMGIFTLSIDSSSISPQPTPVQAQSGLISALGSGASKGLGNCAASLGAQFLGGVAASAVANIGGSALSSLNPLSVPVTDIGTQVNIQKNSLTRVAREGCLDGIMYFTAKEVLNQLADSTLVWVESGFTRFGQEGNRAHVGDLQSFLTNVSEQTFNQFAEEFARVNPSQICGTFSKDVLESVTSQYYANNQNPSGVSPTEAVNNLNINSSNGNGCILEQQLGNEATQEFFEGNFGAGGWEAFAYSIQNPNANPVGAYLAENQRLTQRIQQSQELDLEQLQQNNGWLSAIACPSSNLDDATGKCLDGNGNPTIEPVVQTPGSVVNEAVNNVVGSDFRRLELADETNEIVGALINQLVANITGAGGNDSQGFFDENLANRTDPLGNISNYGQGEGGYSGRVPVEYLAQRLEEQIEIESELLSIVEQLPTTNELSRLEARLNQCLLNGTFADPETVEQQVKALRTARKSVFPATRNNSEEEREVGPQKINWVGNDLQWSPGESYGSNSCGPAHSDAYKGSYVADTDSGTWKLFICATNDSGDFNETSQSFEGVFKEMENSSISGMISTERSLYRTPQNDVTKIDWSGAEFEWKHYDIFAEEFAEFVHDAVMENELVIANGTGNEYSIPGARPNVVKEEIEKIDQILSTGRSADTNRYGATSCDERTVGQMSYVVQPNEKMWTYQECQDLGNNIYRFINTGSTSPAFSKNETINQIDQYVREISSLLGDENYDNSYQAPGDEPDNLRELLNDLKTASEGADNQEIANRKQMIDARFGRMESRFHSQTDLQAARSALDQLNPSNPDSTYSRLLARADANGCPVPDDWTPPEDDNTDDGEGGGNDNANSPSIQYFQANRQTQDIIFVTWQASADSCHAESTPRSNSWSEEVGLSGSRGISQQGSIQLRLVCEQGEENVSESRYIQAYDPNSPGPQQF